MAYLRFYAAGNPVVPQCDVYVYMGQPGLICHNCRTVYEDRRPAHHFTAGSTAGMAQHLREHAARGHAIPGLDAVIAEMEQDDRENFG